MNSFKFRRIFTFIFNIFLCLIFLNGSQFDLNSTNKIYENTNYVDILSENTYKDISNDFCIKDSFSKKKESESKNSFSYNIHVGDVLTLPISIEDSDTISASIKGSKVIKTIDETPTFKILEEGEEQIIVSVTKVDNTSVEYYYNLTIKPALRIEDINNSGPDLSSFKMKMKKEYILTLDVLNMFDDDKIVFQSSDPSILKVDEKGRIYSQSSLGSALIHISIINQKTNISKSMTSIKVEVEKDNTVLYIIIIAICVLLLIGIFFIYFILIKKTKDKKDLPEYNK